VKSNRFDTAIDVILVLNAMTILMQDYSMLVGHDTGDPENDETLDTKWEKLETLFTALYVLEVMLKVTINGWKKYKESARNLFDFFVTCMTIVASFYVYCECGVLQ
jgi:two pore calcium channel protein